MTDNVCGKTTIYNEVMPKRKEKAEAQNNTNQRATKKRRISKATKMQNDRVQLMAMWTTKKN
jgi:hypothetical protein